jgi:predicted AAA+ superfamily ATPase
VSDAETVPQLVGDPVVGPSWEGFVIETLLGAAAWPSQASFYRTSAGAEVDLVIDYPDGRRWWVEVERGLSAGVRRGIRKAFEDLRAERGFVVHAGDDRYPLAPRLEVIGLRELAAELARGA